MLRQNKISRGGTALYGNADRRFNGADCFRCAAKSTYTRSVRGSVRRRLLPGRRNYNIQVMNGKQKAHPCGYASCISFAYCNSLESRPAAVAYIACDTFICRIRCGIALLNKDNLYSFEPRGSSGSSAHLTVLGP